MSEIAHSPLPWSLSKSDDGIWHIRSGDDYVGSCMYADDMRHIVTAVNAYDKQRALIETLTAALDECEDYFDNRADADCDQDGYVPNDEMRRLTTVRDALDAAKKEGF